ncbi:hypothetical protein MKX03_026012 [Papaver bracteatum]|nr:hypothetical protein MKX03_026012 [Papaver bracteatum]
MLDINLFRKAAGQEIIRESQRRRFTSVELVDEVIRLDEEWRKRQFELDNLRKERNNISKEVRKLMISSEDATEKIKSTEECKQCIAAKEAQVQEAKDLLYSKLELVGNLVHDSVPVGIDEVIICEGFFLKGVGVKLNQALISFGLEFLEKREYTLLQTPFFMRKDIMTKCAQLSQFDEELYKVTGEGDDKYLIATAEEPLCAYHIDDWIQPTELPIRYAGYSTCFRKEAGSHGRDTLGIFRVHQFETVEQFCMTSPNGTDSWKMHEEMIKNSEDFYKDINLPHRVVSVVSGALNDAAAKKYNLEAHFPASNAYRELVSCSNCTDFQSRKLEIRFGQKKIKEQGKQYCHLLNSTRTATERTICCILENYQKEDGVEIPTSLQPFMGGLTFIPFQGRPSVEVGKGTLRGNKAEGNKLLVLFRWLYGILFGHQILKN